MGGGGGGVGWWSRPSLGFSFSQAEQLLFLQIIFYRNFSQNWNTHLNFLKMVNKVLEQFGDLLIKPFYNMSKIGVFGKIQSTFGN